MKHRTEQVVVHLRGGNVVTTGCQTLKEAIETYNWKRYWIKEWWKEVNEYTQHLNKVLCSKEQMELFEYN